MTAKIIDGKQVSSDIRAEIHGKVASLALKGIKPGLGVILVGEDPASVSYVTGKEKACAENGIASFEYRLPAGISEAELLSCVEKFNADRRVNGILVQLPLPSHIDEQKVIAAIRPDKDVDGFTPINIGKMVLGEDCFVPCTPQGVLELIRRSGVETKGANTVIVGRSNIVGRPLMILMSSKAVNATVTVCHTATTNLAAYCRNADILIACAGKPGMIKAEMIKPGACVIDVGVNRVPDSDSKRGYRLKGDVDYEAAKEVAGWITPVPGGVGPMTITMLLANTVKAASN
ncbi:MAG: bifunctional methylenetetrahydrofolate dehydrogenase/methenyltetrahydrofolate cyclohydrolase FolD [Spirochaetaceae bacterium]|nr:bifunctional methylenetetrahydrofolate dehydrogenase/methenyltetrahydrofolate cyclohydrolase FolD [Spirochaetaceae bacterium]